MEIIQCFSNIHGSLKLQTCFKRLRQEPECILKTVALGFCLKVFRSSLKSHPLWVTLYIILGFNVLEGDRGNGTGWKDVRDLERFSEEGWSKVNNVWTVR